MKFLQMTRKKKKPLLRRNRTRKKRKRRSLRLLLQRNKWVISHPEREPLMKQGAFPGLIGENKELHY